MASHSETETSALLINSVDKRPDNHSIVSDCEKVLVPGEADAMPDEDELQEDVELGKFRWKPALFLIPVVLAQYSMSLLVQPIAPKIMKHELGSDRTAAAAQTIADAIFAVLLLVMTGLLGMATDAYGRRPFLMACAFINLLPAAALLIPYALGVNWPMLYIVMNSFNKQFGNNPTFYMAYISDMYVSLKHRTFATALVGAAGGLGILSGLFVMVPGIKHSELEAVVILLGGLAVFYIGTFLPEPLERHRQIPFDAKRLSNPFKPVMNVTKSRVVVACSVIMVCDYGAESGLGDVIQYFLNSRLNFGSGGYATAAALTGIGVIINVIFILPRLLKRFHPMTLCFVGLLCVVLQLVFLVIIWATWAVYAIIVPLTVAIKLIKPSVFAVVMNDSRSNMEQGLRVQTVTTFATLGGAIGALIMGQLFRISGKGGALPFIVMIVVVGAALPMSVWLRKYVKHATRQSD